MTNDDPFARYFPDGFTIRDEANALVAWAFRNGPVEDLHGIATILDIQRTAHFLHSANMAITLGDRIVDHATD